MRLSRKLLMVGGRLPPDFLELVSTTTGTNTGTSNNFSITLPAIEPNDLVVVSLVTNSDSPTINSSGWSRADGASSAALHATLLIKVVDGSESSISCKTQNEQHRRWVVHVYRSKTGRIPKISAIYVASLSGSSVDLPAITPDGGVHGVQKFTFIAAFGNYNNYITSVPAGYENYTQVSYGSRQAIIAQHELEAASDDPGAFTFTKVGGIRLFQFAIWEE